MALNVDTRTATEYGVVRTFGQADFTYSTQGYSGGMSNSNNTTGNILTGNTQNNYAGNGVLGVEYAFIQFAGFTFGKSASAYVTPWQGFPGNNTSYLVGGYDTITGINNVQYTAQLGNGVSAKRGHAFDGASLSLFDGPFDARVSVSRRDRACRRAHGRQGRCAPLARWPEDGPSLTAAARDDTGCAQVGMEGWCRSNKRMEH